MDYSDSYKVERFERFEKIFFRIELAILATGIFFLVLFQVAIDSLAFLVDLWMSLFLLGLAATVANFFIAIVRTVKYLFNIRKLSDSPTIWRTALVLILSPLSFMLMYLLIFIAALSSCST